MSKTCFVVMAIGEQIYDGKTVTASDLRSKYGDLIREAIIKAYPDIEVARADEIAIPGSITSDIVARIIHSDIVIADVTYPNPNVFYELGLRHASRAGTIIIKDKNGPRVPFDIAHLRYIEYENTPSGLKELSSRLKVFIDFSLANPDKPDNTFLEFAKYTKHKGYDFADEKTVDANTEMMMAMFKSPELLGLLVRASSGEDIPQAELFRIMAENPEAAAPMIRAMAQSANDAQNVVPQNRAARRKGPKK